MLYTKIFSKVNLSLKTKQVDAPPDRNRVIPAWPIFVLTKNLFQDNFGQLNCVFLKNEKSRFPQSLKSPRPWVPSEKSINEKVYK